MLKSARLSFQLSAHNDHQHYRGEKGENPEVEAAVLFVHRLEVKSFKFCTAMQSLTFFITYPTGSLQFVPHFSSSAPLVYEGPNHCIDSVQFWPPRCQHLWKLLLKLVSDSNCLENGSRNLVILLSINPAARTVTTERAPSYQPQKFQATAVKQVLAGKTWAK